MDSNYQAVGASKPVASHLEALPNEAKLMILRQLPDLLTVSSIVHASPAFHQVYRLARVEILTRFTIEHLLDVNEHALERTAFMSIAFHGGEGAHGRYQISCALSRIWTLVENEQTIELPVEDCLALLRMRGFTCLNAQKYGY